MFRRFFLFSAISKSQPKSGNTLLKAIYTVMNGEKYFEEAITSLVFEDFYKKEKTSQQTLRQLQSTVLSKCKMEVLGLIASGKTNKEVADQLFISVKTVDTHKMHYNESK